MDSSCYCSYLAKDMNDHAINVGLLPEGYKVIWAQHDAYSYFEQRKFLLP